MATLFGLELCLFTFITGSNLSITSSSIPLKSTMPFQRKKPELKKGRGANCNEADLSTVAESVDNNIEISLCDDDDDGDDERKERKKKMKKWLFERLGLGLFMFLLILGVNAASLDNRGNSSMRRTSLHMWFLVSFYPFHITLSPAQIW